MNKYLEKLAGRLSAVTKNWVRTEAKSAIPDAAKANASLKNGNLKAVKSSIVVEAKKKWSWGKNNPGHPSSEAYRASGVLDRVVAKSLK